MLGIFICRGSWSDELDLGYVFWGSLGFVRGFFGIVGFWVNGHIKQFWVGKVNSSVEFVFGCFD